MLKQTMPLKRLEFISIQKLQIQKAKSDGLKLGITESIAKGIEKGKSLGLEEGLEKGAQKERVKNIKQIHSEGIPLEIISKISDLSINEIKNILG